MTDTTQPTQITDTLRETAARGVEAIHAIVAERDTLRQHCEKLEVEVAMLMQDLASTKQRLTLSTVERDHYMRHTVELTTRLSNIQIVINDTIKEAQDAAFRPAPIVTAKHPEAVSADDVSNLKSLLDRLQKNGGSNDEVPR